MTRTLLIPVILLLAMLAAGCSAPHADTEQAPAAGSGPTTIPGAGPDSPADHTLLVEPDDGRAALLSTIAGARDNITLTIYELNDPAIVSALKEAEGRGVAVRVIYNNQSFASMHEKNPNAGAVADLSAAGAGTMPASPAFAVTHQKTLTADASRSVIMTFNLEPGYFGATRDFAIVTTNASEVQEIARVFDADWACRPVTPACPSLVWSPVNSREKLLGIIDRANATLDVYNEEINDPQCIAALVAAAKRGVAVRVIAADLAGSGGGNGNAPALATLNAGGVETQVITSLYIHAKMVLADYGTADQAAYVGSENLGTVSLDRNRELGIIVTDGPVLDRLHTVFLADWGGKE
jgi:phosphatidylserine/phosphatidylglycerophosphate/cardiolipin synthase-like enzyme